MLKPKEVKRKANDVDICVGKNLKFYRMKNKSTQEQLAKAVGVSFQQIQKYESGFNRLNSSAIYSAAKFLNISISDLYSGLDTLETDKNLSPNFLHSLDKNGLEMIALYQKIENKNAQKALLNMIKIYVSDHVK